MYDHPFTLELVTPERVVYRGEVNVLTVPGSEGSLQVLRNHAPLLTALEIGRIRIRDAKSAEIDYATSGGFLEVRNNLVTILAETAERADEIDAERSRRAKERAESRLHIGQHDVDYDRARGALQRAVNRINISGKVI